MSITTTTTGARTVTEGPAASTRTVPTTTSTRAGVGFSELPRSREAGSEAAREALARAGLTGCDLAIMFSTGRHDPAQLRDGVRSVVGPHARIFGGFGDGVITSHRLGYDGLQVGVLAVASSTIQVDMFVERGLPNNERNVGRALGRQIASAACSGDPNLILLYDTVKEPSASGASFNMATPLLAGMTEVLPSWPQTVGGALTGSLAFNPTYQWFDDRIEQGTALALALSGGVRMHTVVMHGARPSSGYHTVTKADSRVVLELDGRPATDVIDELIGPDVDWRAWPILVTLGVNMGDRYGDYVDDNYVSRVCQAIDAARGGLEMINDDLQPGTEVQLMRVWIDPAYMERRVAEVLARLAGRRPLFAVYFDCVSRESRLATVSGAVSEDEEAETIQRALGPDIPLLGMYSAGELAQSGPQRQVLALNITGVLGIFSEPQ